MPDKLFSHLLMVDDVHAVDSCAGVGIIRSPPKRRRGGTAILVGRPPKRQRALTEAFKSPVKAR